MRRRKRGNGQDHAAAARRAGVADERVLTALERVDRAGYVPGSARGQVAHDAPVPIGLEQTTSQPSLIALMLEAARVEPGDRVLEVGAGLGYQTALLCEIGAEVHAVERHAELAEQARRNLAADGHEARVVAGDGSRGLLDAAPFDAIVVGAATATIPSAWREQLVEGGRLVVPVGGPHSQVVEVHERLGADLRLADRLTPVRFVPLVTDEP